MFTYLGEYKCVSQSPGCAVECCHRPTLRRPGLGPNIYLRIKIRYRYKSPFLCEVCFKYSLVLLTAAVIPPPSAQLYCFQSDFKDGHSDPHWGSRGNGAPGLTLVSTDSQHF